ncbi:MAG: ABC transporter permease [Pseudomonadota bacterium]
MALRDSDAEAAIEPAIPGPPRFQFLRVLFALIARETATRYSRGSGGYIWAVATPSLQILVMSFVFALMFRTPSLGNSFILFYTTGYLPFHMYLMIQNDVMGAVKVNRALMQYPAVTPVDAMLSRALLGFLTQIVITTVILTGAIQSTDTPVNLDLAKMALALLTAAFLGLGVGSVNCVLIGFFPTWERFWTIMTTPLFIISAILFLYEEAPPVFQGMLWFNPLVHVTASMRSGVFGAYQAAFVELIYVWSISSVAAILGFYMARRRRSRLVNPRYR